MISKPLAVCSLLVFCGFLTQPARAAGPVGLSRGVAGAPRAAPGVAGGLRQGSPGFSVSIPVPQGSHFQSPPIQQGTRLQSSVRASHIIIPLPGGRGTTQTRTIISGAPARFPTPAPFHFDGRHDFRRHHRFHRFPPFIFFGVPQFIGPAFVTAPFVPALPFFPGTAWTWIEPGLSEIPRDYFGARGIDRLAPFDPTPQEVVERMLALAAVHAGDVVYDLGAGDGRVVITAAKKYGVKAVGYELDPGLAKLARENVRKQSVEKLVEIREQDFMSADLSPATVVTLYLSQDGNLAVRFKLLRELKPESRVVSYTFDMGDWQPKVVESYRDAGGNRHMLYFWQMSQPLLFSDGKR